MAKLGMGMMRLPLLDENDQTSIDIEHVNKMVDAYMDAGFNYLGRRTGLQKNRC